MILAIVTAALVAGLFAWGLIEHTHRTQAEERAHRLAEDLAWWRTYGEAQVEGASAQHDEELADLHGAVQELEGRVVAWAEALTQQLTHGHLVPVSDARALVRRCRRCMTLYRAAVHERRNDLVQRHHPAPAVLDAPFAGLLPPAPARVPAPAAGADEPDAIEVAMKNLHQCLGAEAQVDLGALLRGCPDCGPAFAYALREAHAARLFEHHPDPPSVADLFPGLRGPHGR